MEDVYYRKSQIKDIYNISYTTIRNWEKRGIIVGIGNGVLFSKNEIEKALTRPRQKSGRKKKP